MEEKYKLIDLVSFTKDAKAYYMAIVYFYGKGHNDLLKIVIDKETYNTLQGYENMDITNYICINYNSFNKVFKPYIKIV